MAPFTALYDACVLYPAMLRDTLMRLALTGLFRAKWSEDIHREWMTRLRTKRPDLDPARLDHVRLLMDRHVRDAVVENDRHLIPALELPDPDDRHVLAAAIRGHADVIVTYDLRHFPPSTLKLYGIEAQHPDEFIDHLVDLDEARVLAAIRDQRAAVENPTIGREDFVASLDTLRLKRTAKHLRRAIHLI